MPLSSTDATAAPGKPDTLELVHQAIGTLGAATAAEIAAHAAIAYSTVTPKLRILADVGRAEFFRDSDGRGKWRTTDSTGDVEWPTATGPTAPPIPTADDGNTTPIVTTPVNEPAAADDLVEDDDPAATAAAAAPLTAGQPSPGVETPPAAPAPTAEGAEANGSAVPRRRKGTIPKEILAVMQAHPDIAYKVGELSTVLGGTSMGAIANALHKLVIDGTVTQTVEKPATFQAL